MTSALDRLLADLEAHGAPDFAWVVEFAPDGDINAAVARAWRADATLPQVVGLAKVCSSQTEWLHAVVWLLREAPWKDSKPWISALSGIQNALISGSTKGLGPRIRAARRAIPLEASRTVGRSEYWVFDSLAEIVMASPVEHRPRILHARALLDEILSWHNDPEKQAHAAHVLARHLPPVTLSCVTRYIAEL
jgi:hypothetical protein